MQLKEDDVVMCTVKSIEGTSVFLEIEGNGQGTMIMSEVAAGRIRNLREYVAPNKKIVCKILKISPDGHVHLSLRRVTGKEREQVQERYKKERTLMSMLKTACKNPEACIEQIRKSYELWDFYDKIRVDPKLIEKIMSKGEAESLGKLVAEKKEKEKIVKKIITIKSLADTGIKEIKDILNEKDVDIYYLGSSRFSVGATALDFKDANTKVNTALENMERKAKEKKAVFEVAAE